MLNNLPTADQLRAARAMMKVTQEVVAQRAGLSAKTLISVEQGKSSLSAYNAVVTAYLSWGIKFFCSDDFREQTITRVHAEPVKAPAVHAEYALGAR